MASQSFKDPSDVLHAAKLYMTPAGIIGRRVTCRIEATTFSAFVMSCTIEKSAMTLEVSLGTFDKRKIHAIVYAAPTNEWLVRFQNGTIDIDHIEFSAS